jgi:hypothetical protein
MSTNKNHSSKAIATSKGSTSVTPAEKASSRADAPTLFDIVQRQQVGISPPNLSGASTSGNPAANSTSEFNPDQSNDDLIDVDDDVNSDSPRARRSASEDGEIAPPPAAKRQRNSHSSIGCWDAYLRYQAENGNNPNATWLDVMGDPSDAKSAVMERMLTYGISANDLTTFGLAFHTIEQWIHRSPVSGLEDRFRGFQKPPLTASTEPPSTPPVVQTVVTTTGAAITIGEKLPTLKTLNNSNGGEVSKWCEAMIRCAQDNISRSPRLLIHSNLLVPMRIAFQKRFGKVYANHEYLDLPVVDFCTLMRTMFCNRSTDSKVLTVIDQLMALKFDFGNKPREDKAFDYLTAVSAIISDAQVPDDENVRAVSALIDGLASAQRRFGTVNTVMQNHFQKLPQAAKPGDVTAYLDQVHSFIVEAEKMCRAAAVFDDPSNNGQPPKGKTASGGGDSIQCNGCGRRKWKGCPCKCEGHPDRNTTSAPFSQSATLRTMRDRGCNFECLDLRSRADGSALDAETTKVLAASAKRFDEAKAKLFPKAKSSLPSKGASTSKKGKMDLFALPAITNDFSDNHVVKLPIFNVIAHSGASVQVNTLLDSGSLQGNFLSQQISDFLKREGTICVNSSVLIRLANDRNTIKSNGSFYCDISFFNELKNVMETITSCFVRVLESKFDLIIGLPTIRAYNLTQKIPSFFVDDGTPVLNVRSGDTKLIESDPLSISNMKERTRRARSSSMSNLIKELQLCTIGDVVDKLDLIDAVDNSDYITWPENPFDTPEEEHSGHFLERIDIQGSEGLQTSLKKLCQSFPEIFLEQVQRNPARVTPMKLEVDKTKWETKDNSLPCRQQSKSKQDEIDKQVTNYLKLGVIKPCSAAYHSQVHLVPKPKPNEWRFCLDFVRLNTCTKGIEGWPIPNVAAMLNRIGSRGATIFGVLDLTSGYHQTPIDEASQIFTAFKCIRGVYCWQRVPMGLKNAASYFQRVMATEVLSEIIHISCELYIDDILVFGRDEQEFLDNVRDVFTRLQKHGITLNPKKCQLGLRKVVYVGHELDGTTLSFSKEKRLKVLEFPIPKTKKDLQSFLGLVNYFRDHVPNITELLHPLRVIMPEQKKKYATLTWTPEAEAAFHQARKTVSNCQALFFPAEHGKIVVMTDASDYGIGAYIYQIVDGKERPIIFMSKSLHGAELNWSTIEKEAYAIFSTLTKFAHLLRDSKFLLRTDHKNLTYINLGVSQKVQRWKLALQEFDFDIEHVAGIDNTVADAFSRLCPPPIHDVNILRIEDVTIPPEARLRISQHHGPLVGHFGVEKTMKMLHKNQLRWRHMRAHVRKFIHECPSCQKLSQIKPAIKAFRFTAASYHPMDVLNIDTIGPVAKDDFGNEHIIVIIDAFTRWVELYPVPDTSAKAAARALLQHASTFGVPGLLRSDRGSQYVNDIIADFSILTMTDQDHGVAYSKEENTIVERTNKEVLRHLRAIIFDKRIQCNWSMDHLPLVKRILNAEQKTSTGVSPAELLFGNAIDIGRRILYEPSLPAGQEPIQLSEYMNNLLMQQNNLLQVAFETQQRTDTHHMSQYDDDFTEFPINSYVLVEPPEGSAPKLNMRKKGPFLVVNHIGNVYTLKHLLNNRKDFDIHISRLTPFHFDPTVNTPEEVAMHDEQEFTIESILGHRGDTNRRSTMQFLVKWFGYADEENSWEPFHNLRNTQPLIDYLNQNRLRKLIPKQHK